MVIFVPATTPVHVIVYFLYKDTGNKQNGNNFAVSMEKALKNNRSAGDFRSNDAHVTLLYYIDHNLIDTIKFLSLSPRGNALGVP